MKSTFKKDFYLQTTVCRRATKGEGGARTSKWLNHLRCVENSVKTKKSSLSEIRIIFGLILGKDPLKKKKVFAKFWLSFGLNADLV